VTKDWYISAISDMSDRYGDYLIELMGTYKATCLAEITKEQAKNFYDSLNDQILENDNAT
jgi:hypothetical protein